jgi:hypothetical protein
MFSKFSHFEICLIHHDCHGDSNNCDTCWDLQFDDVYEKFIETACEKYNDDPCKYDRIILKQRFDQCLTFIPTKANNFLINRLHEELIASAMYPSRIMKQIEYYDDIEDFFNNY